MTPPVQGNHLTIGDFKNIRTTLHGNNTYFDWDQLDSEDPTDSNGPQMDVSSSSPGIIAQVHGAMNIGFKFKGNPFKGRDLLTVYIYYNAETAQMNHHYTHWFYTIN